jgi:mannosyltransferase
VPGSSGWRRDAWILAGLVLVAFGLRLACARQSLFGDELFLYAAVNDRSLGDMLSVVHDTEKTPPLGFVLSWLFARGDAAPELTRVPSFVASAATVPLVYALGLRTVGRAAGLVAAAWLAISPFELFYGSESRSYALVMAFVVASTVCLLLALDTGRRRWWVLYAVAAAAACYSHYIAALTLAPQAAWALWRHREALREQLLAGGAVVLALVPWLPSLVVQADHSSEEAARLAVLAPLTASNVAEAAGKSLAGHPFVSLTAVPGRAVVAVLVAVLLVAAALAFRRRGELSPPGRGVLLALLAVAPVVGLLLYSLQPDTSFILARNFSTAVPYEVLLVAWLLTSAGARAAIALSVAALAALAVGTGDTLRPENERTDARDAASYIDTQAPPAVPVVDVQYPYRGPPATGTRIYLDRPHRIYRERRWLAAWRTASRARSPIVTSVPKQEALLRLFVPPPRYAGGYRVVAEHTSGGLRPILTREYAPR